MAKVITMDGTPVTQPSEKKRKQKIPFFGWALGSVLFGAISAVVSGIGAYQLLLNSLGKYEAIAAATIFTIIVQLSIVALIFAVVRKLDFSIKFLVGVGLLVMWFLSITAASGSVWYALRASEFAKGINEHRLGTITAPLSTAGAKLLKVTQSMNDVATLANSRAKREKNKGDSCGYVAGKGKGSRFRLRMSHNAQAKQYSALATKQYQKIEATIMKANSVQKINSAMLAKVYADANQILHDGTLDQIRSWARDAAKGYKSFFPSAKKNGANLVCVDDKMANALLQAVRAIDQVPALPSSAPREKTVSMSESLLLSYKRTFAFLLPSSTAVSDAPSGADAMDYVTLVPPAIIEFMILLFALIRESFIRKAGIGQDEYTEFMKQRGPNRAKDFHQIERFVTGQGLDYTLFDLMERLVLPVNRDQFLIVPLGGNNDLSTQVKRIVQYLQLDDGDKHKFPAHGFDAKKLPDWFKEYNSDVLQNVESVHIYPLPESAKVWRKNSIRDYINTMILQAPKTA